MDDYPNEEDVNLNDGQEWIAVYDVERDPSIKYVYENITSNPREVLESLHKGKFVDEKRINGFRFARKFSPDESKWIRISHSGDEIESIHFEKSKSGILWLFDSQRKIKSGEKLNLFMMPADTYHMQNMSESIRVKYIVYREDHCKRMRSEFPYGSTPTWKFLGVSPNSARK